MKTVDFYFFISVYSYTKKHTQIRMYYHINTLQIKMFRTPWQYVFQVLVLNCIVCFLEGATSEEIMLWYCLTCLVLILSIYLRILPGFHPNWVFSFQDLWVHSGKSHKQRSFHQWTLLSVTMLSMMIFQRTTSLARELRE